MVKKVWGALRIPSEDSDREREVKRVRKQFLYYPLVFSICFTVPLIRRIFEFVDNIWDTELRKDKILLALHHTLGPLQGFLNALIYGFGNQEVYNKLKSFFCCFFIYLRNKCGGYQAQNDS